MQTENIIEAAKVELELKYLEIYAYCDPAAGKDARSKAVQCRQVVVVAARDWLSRWFFIHIWAGRVTAGDLKRKVLDVQEKFSPRLFGIEANGMQVLFGSLVREEARLRGEHVKIIPIYQPTNVDKNYRIRTGIEPALNYGRLFLPYGDIEATSEIQGFPTAMWKDIIDAMETCMRMAPKRPIKTRTNAERESYAKYLRSTRLAASLIEKKLAEFDAKSGNA